MSNPASHPLSPAAVDPLLLPPSAPATPMPTVMPMPSLDACQGILLPVSFGGHVGLSAEGLSAEAQDPTSRTNQPAAGGAPTGGAGAAGGGQVQVPGDANGGGGGGAAPASPCGDSSMLYMLPLFAVLMWFMVLRPEQKRRKEQQSLLASIKTGDDVVMLSGMHGEVQSLTETTVTLRVDTILMTFDRTAVARIERDETVQPETK
ncbi:MAG: preprotein translocase subunit YajC [Planctomycetota bacterium]